MLQIFSYGTMKPLCTIFSKLQYSVNAPWNCLRFHWVLLLLSLSLSVSLALSVSAMHFQEWLRSIRSNGGIKVPESEDFWSLLPSFPLSSFSLSSLSLSPSSLLGIGALASLTAYWLVTRPRPMRPPCDLQAQSVAVEVSGSWPLSSYCLDSFTCHPSSA